MLTLHTLFDVLLAVFLLKTAFLILFSFLHLIRNNKAKKDIDLFISVLIPAYNEELTIKNCVQSLLAQTYHNYEIIVIDDGSKDDTLKIANKLGSRSNKIKVIHKQNGGKSTALNIGIKNATGEIIVCVDSDTVLHPNSLAAIANVFNDPEISAVSGNVKVANSENFWGISQALEHVNSLAIQRRAFAFFKTTHVIPGAIGAFRKYKLMEAGLFSSETLVEDMDLTMKLASQGDKIEFCPTAIAYTEAPTSMTNLYKQRYRWSYGTWQILRIYSKNLLKSSPIFSTLLFPYLFFFSLMGVLTSLIFIFLFVFSLLYGIMHYFVFYLMLFIFLRFILSLYSTYNLNDSKFLTFFTLQEYLFYTHIVSLISLKSLIDILLNRSASWNRIPRLGKNLISSSYEYHLQSTV